MRTIWLGVYSVLLWIALKCGYFNFLYFVNDRLCKLKEKSANRKKTSVRTYLNWITELISVTDICIRQAYNQNSIQTFDFTWSFVKPYIEIPLMIYLLPVLVSVSRRKEQLVYYWTIIWIEFSAAEIRKVIRRPSVGIWPNKLMNHSVQFSGTYCPRRLFYRLQLRLI